MSRFTAEEYLEILRARERLAKVRVKDYGYPERINTEEARPEPIGPPKHKLYDELQQAKGLVLYLQEKLNEHLDRKPRSKYD